VPPPPRAAGEFCLALPSSLQEKADSSSLEGARGWGCDWGKWGRAGGGRLKAAARPRGSGSECCLATAAACSRWAGAAGPRPCVHGHHDVRVHARVCARAPLCDSVCVCVCV
jgi:hypothetical protein